MRILKVVLGGFILGLIIQFNWAQGILIEKGLIACIEKHWLRLLISGISASLLFYGLFYLLNNFKYLKLNKELLIDFFSGFKVLICYLFFSPSDTTLTILLILIPIFIIIKKYIKNIFTFNSFKHLFYFYLLIFVFLFYKEILLIIYSGRVCHYTYYTSLFIAPIALLAFPLLIPQITKVYAIFISLLYFLPIFITNSHIILYRADIPPTTYYAIWETTITESTDFIKEYISFPIIGINLLLLFFVLLILKQIKKPCSTISIKIRFTMFLILIVFVFFSNTFDLNIPYKFVKSYVEFKAELNKFQDAFNIRQNNPLSEQPPICCTDSEQTFVLIIGESASKYHQSLYGYHRNTNPLTSSIKDELYLFDSVISPHSHTNPSLAKMLTFANFENMEALFSKRSLIEYMKDAGYKTYWISNQQFAGEFNTLSTMIGLQADVKYFSNLNYVDSVGSKPIYDEVLLEPLQKAISDKNKKKFIVLHLMGSHSDKAKRYPEKYNFFADTSDIPYKPYNRPWVYYIINIHDNSVLYTDFILYKTLQLLKNQNTSAIWLYLSDHGEEIFDYRDFWGHSEGNSSIYMYDIPFILWLSGKYKNRHKEKVEKFNHYLSRKYQTDDLIHSIIDLTGCYSDDFVAEKSIFNPNFMYEKRYMYGHNYDSLILVGKKSINDY